MNNFTPRKKNSKKAVQKFDEYYFDGELKQIVKKTGEGEFDFVLEPKVVVSKRNIKEIIDVQSQDVGVYNLLDRIAKTGDLSLMPQEWKQDGIVDYTQMPTDLMEAVDIANSAESLVNQLPDALKGSTIEETLKGLTDEQVLAYLHNLRNGSTNSGDEKKGENE